MILPLLLVIATFTLLLAGPADTVLTRHRLSRRATAIAHRASTLPPRTTAAPLLRTAVSPRDAWLAAHIPGANTLQSRLARAGNPCSLSALCAAALLLAISLATLALALGLSLPTAIPTAAATTFAATLGATATAIRRRRAAFTRGFPDAVALIVRSLRAGLPIAGAVTEAGRAGANPTADVFAKVAEEMRLGQPLETALWAAAANVRLADFDFLVVTIALQGETGGNLAETLAGLDETLRMRRQLALKVKAMAAEARASALIIGCLPFAMGALLWATSPEYLLPLFTTAMGRALVAAGLFSLGVGALIINQLMQVEA
nr:type II secretion system F family protein [Polymorphobacter sp.]